MLNCMFFALILVLFTNFSFGAISFSGIDRSFQLMYKGVIEASVLRVDEHGKPCRPYISKKLLEENAEYYFANNISRYVTHYKTSYFYFNLEDESYCSSSYCYGVKISLAAEINNLFSYNKARNYYVVNSSYGK